MTLQLGFDFGPSAAPAARADARAHAPVAAARPTASAISDEAPRVVSAPMPFLLRSPDQALSRASQLSTHIATQLREPVRVAFTDNRRTMLSARRRAGKLEVRLHHMFLDADDVTLNAIGAYLGRSDRAASGRIDAYIAAAKTPSAAASGAPRASAWRARCTTSTP